MKFIADKMLGRLCKWLRILGYDCIYFTDREKIELIYSSLRDDRIILTRDSRLKEKKRLKLLFIKSQFIKEQLEQVIKDLKLAIDIDKVFSRCLICNREVKKINKESVKDRIPQYVYDTQESFSKCDFCDKVYWRGTHWDKIISDFKQIKQKNNKN